jgi:hypothetical protein
MSALVSWSAPLDPNELKDYTHSFAAELTRISDTIASSDFILSSDATTDGLTIDSQSATDTTGTVWLTVSEAKQADAGWEAGKSYEVRHQITTVGGRTFERSIGITVKQL